MSFLRIVGLGALVSFVIGLSYSLWTARAKRVRSQPGSIPVLRVLAPAGLFSSDFKKRLLDLDEPIELRSIDTADAVQAQRDFEAFSGDVESENVSPQNWPDAVVVYHTGIQSFMSARSIQSPYHSKFRFPSVVHPDFRKLGRDFDLMDSFPLGWGVLDHAKLDAFTKSCVGAASGNGLAATLDSLALSVGSTEQQTTRPALWVMALAIRAGSEAMPAAQSLVSALINDPELYAALMQSDLFHGSVMREDFFDLKAQSFAKTKFSPAALRQHSLESIQVIRPDEMDRLKACADRTGANSIKEQ